MLIYNRLKCITSFVSLMIMTSIGLFGDIVPYSLNIYSLNNIGSSNNPYQTTETGGPTGAGGSIYTNTSPPPNSGIYANGSVNLYPGPTPASFIQGPIQAGGNVTLSNSGGSGNALSVFGPINAGGNFSSTASGATVNGNITVAGTISAPATTIHGTTTAGVPYTPLLNFSTLSQYFTNASNYWAALPDSAPSIGLSGSGHYIIGLGAGQNIVHLSAAQVSAGGLTVFGPAGSYLIVDVTGGGTLNINSLITGGMDPSDILFNVENASNVVLTGSFDSVLAVNSTVDQNSSTVTGNLIADSLINTLSGNDGSVGGSPFVGFAADQANFAAPEPSTYVLLGSMIAYTVFKQRKVRSGTVTHTHT